MKKILVAILAAVMAASCIFFTACNLEDNTPSSAVTYYELIRENYAVEKEVEDDANDREHIEIPDGAKTVEIDNEEWTVIRSIDEFRSKILFDGDKGLLGSFILANDIDVKQYSAPDDRYFQGRLNGNNYKFYSTEESGGYYGCLFYKMENATVENLIFSASDGYYFWHHDSYAFVNTNVFIAYSAESCTIRNCINYFQPKNKLNNLIESFGGFIHRASNCYIENCVNYADLIARGGIINYAVDCHLVNCKNYGNIVSKYESGGIVGMAQDDNIIEDCINYGNIIGNRYKGGILGGMYLGIDEAFPYEQGLLNENNYKELFIRNCINYGNIYMLKSDTDNRLESLDDEKCPDIYAVGGIAGAAAKVENCKNEGNFYGFESLGKGISVDYTGGIVGVAKEVVNCTNSGTMAIQQGRAKNVGDIYGYLLK